MMRGELVGGDAAQRMPEHHNRAQTEPPQERGGVVDELVAAEPATTVAVTMPALVWSHDTDLPTQVSSQTPEDRTASKAARQGQHHAAVAAEIEIGQTSPIGTDRDPRLPLHRTTIPPKPPSTLRNLSTGFATANGGSGQVPWLEVSGEEFEGSLPSEFG
jgi:hypothetical protein